jgi:hypothetical protein
VPIAGLLSQIPSAMDHEINAERLPRHRFASVTPFWQSGEIARPSRRG